MSVPDPALLVLEQMIARRADEAAERAVKRHLEELKSASEGPAFLDAAGCAKRYGAPNAQAWRMRCSKNRNPELHALKRRQGKTVLWPIRDVDQLLRSES